ncbi:MAG TPA: aminotransferase class V-fold PLP-dependent enzyme, partial [Dehalococcoidia bacterium]|nr:aminotransferase class V-fold PLP-dependent enzyme [Dehalococcoidia bacterium]
MTNADAKLAAVRRGVPVTERLAFFNAGSHGPLAAAAAVAIASAAEEEVRDGRLGALQFQRGGELKNAIRDHFGRLLGCDASEIAVTASTTDGMDIACWGLNWRPGDEIVTSDAEHQGGLSPLYILEHRFGVRVRFAESGANSDRLLSSIESLLNEHTRAVVVSHVSWSTGLVLPLQEIATLAHAAGALVFADGAQSAGAIPIDVRRLGVDAYAVPGQKWLCGPEGTGALYVAKERLDQILPSYVGGGSWASYDLAGRYSLRQDASRFDTPGHPYIPALAGFKASLRWFLGDVGPDWAYARILENAATCRRLLEGIEGVEVLNPPGPHAGLLHFTVAGWDPATVFEELLRRDVLVRS